MIGGPFAQVLEQNRGRFNARFAEARRAKPGLDPAAFAEHLRSVVAPVVETVNAACPEKTGEAAEALYDLSLDLIARDLLGPGSRHPAITEGWSRLLPALPAQLAESPHAFAGAITNALYNLSLARGAQPDAWVASMRELAAVCPDASSLLRAGQVAAWRAGLAHFRSAALEICRSLAPAQARVALGLPPSRHHMPIGPMLDRLAADPWLRPRGASGKLLGPTQLKTVARLGAFRGFGGEFLAPPTVSVSGGTFVVHDGESHWLLHADAFGATFHRTDAPPSTAGSSHSQFRLEPGGKVIHGLKSLVIPDLKLASSWAATPSTLAVTTAMSHAVYLLAVVEGG